MKIKNRKDFQRYVSIGDTVTRYGVEYVFIGYARCDDWKDYHSICKSFCKGRIRLRKPDGYGINSCMTGGGKHMTMDVVLNKMLEEDLFEI